MEQISENELRARLHSAADEITEDLANQELHAMRKERTVQTAPCPGCEFCEFEDEDDEEEDLDDSILKSQDARHESKWEPDDEPWESQK